MPDANEPSIRLFCTDLDHTVLGDDASTRAFASTWRSQARPQGVVLCYNTGRLLDDTLLLLERVPLPKPDYIICGVGTMLYDFNARQQVKAFAEVLDEGWCVDRVQEVVEANFPVILQPSQYQSFFKRSWYLDDATDNQIAEIEDLLEENGLEVNVIYSSHRDLDVLPKYANKGNALTWLLKHLGIPKHACVVAGDSGNDGAMFHKRGISGIVVANAQPELQKLTSRNNVYAASAPQGFGVIEGLIHYGVVERAVSPEEEEHEREEAPLPPEVARVLEDTECGEASEVDYDFLREAYAKAVEGLRKNMTPEGFSACSLEHNETRGTDENYRSVWARDGAITVIGALKLADEDIRACQRATLETLLGSVSPPGQIPSNVSIDSGKPDYSGVGGICAIDGGLWVIIAFYEFVRATGDLEFLRKWAPVMQRVIDWISAHDGNNDALLEIPEAGDWTDLFGRSYNVLYDEILWYRANVCFGRMQEFLGSWAAAGDYLRWSVTIKRAILRKFWPSTAERNAPDYSFADNQLSLGDTSYLIAQVTPFDFDWRCDVFGNVLAYLMGVLDEDRARIAFRFLWGAGVNQPYPVANLYPTVQAGDPIWRSYYVVNLLNLPEHYHNGGIWPFIGAQWVRFVNRLGMRNLALAELENLARLNQRGIRHEWEFNEWAHGQTGHPMGKAFQAWSCSEFIASCHELNIF